MQKLRRAALLLIVIVGALAGPAVAAPHEPARGSAERRAILDAVRPAIEQELGAPVEFVVALMRVSQGFAFLQLEPQRPGGAQIDLAETALDPDFTDGLTTYALVEAQGGGWVLVDWVIGPTDVAWWGWWDAYGAPRDIFPQ